MRLRIELRIIQELKRQLLSFLGSFVRLFQISSPQCGTADPGKSIDVFGIDPALRTISSQYVCGGLEVIPGKSKAHVFNDACGSRDWKRQQKQKNAKKHRGIHSWSAMQQKHPRDTLSVYLRIHADWCGWADGV
jgi:hypothetical protein